MPVTYTQEESDLLVESIERNISYHKSRLKQKSKIVGEGDWVEHKRDQRILDLEFKIEQLESLLVYTRSELS